MIFQRGRFTLASGRESDWKIECDALDDEDWKTLAALITRRLEFQTVTGIARGGLKLASMLRHSIVPGSDRHLIVDDVYTTGESMRGCRDNLIKSRGLPADCFVGVVVFARAKTRDDAWVLPMFQIW